MKTVNNFPEEVELYKFTFKNSEEEGEYRISGTSLQEAINTANKMITHDAFDKLVEYKRNWENISTTYQGSPTDNRFFRQAERTLLQMKNNLI